MPLSSFLVLALTLAGAASTAADAPPGGVFRDCSDCPWMVVLPAGRFMMGSPLGEPGRFEDEGPRHPVEIPGAFALSHAPVTRDQYAAFVRATGHPVADACAVMRDEGWTSTPGAGWRDPGFEQRGDHPVVCVDWHDAVAYAAWLTARTGHHYRLPTEAEFEYAARAGRDATFPWGDAAGDICRHANVFDLAARRLHPGWAGEDCDDGHAFTAPVAAFPTNAFGLLGMTGNVYQWTADCFVEGGYAGAPNDGSARDAGPCEARAIRGGSWLNSARGQRAAMRDRDRPGDRYTNVGLRVVRELPDTAAGPPADVPRASPGA
ncbi:formylglycine-generating enzyme family protein [Luteimonas pelagia]